MAPKTDQKRPGLKQEALAVFGIFVSLFIYLSLFSVSFKMGGAWCGKIGLLLAGLLLDFTGWGAYMLPTLTLLLSFLFFRPRMSFDRLPQVTAGLSMALISFCGLLSSLTIKDPELLDTGGFLGRTGFILLQSVIGNGALSWSSVFFF